MKAIWFAAALSCTFLLAQRPLQAEVDIAADGERLALLKTLGDELRFVLVTSRADVTRGPDAIRAAPSKHFKCARCWHWRADVGADPRHPEICGRCVANLFVPGELARTAHQRSAGLYRVPRRQGRPVDRLPG